MASAGSTRKRRKRGAWRRYGRSAACTDSVIVDNGPLLLRLGTVATERVSAYHEPRRRGSVVAAGVWLWLRCVGLSVRRRGTARDDKDDEASCVIEVGRGGAVNGVEVSGAKAWSCALPLPCLSLDARGCGFVGTAVCVELLDADELDGVGEDGREGVGVRAEEVSGCAGLRGVDDVGLGVVGADDGAGSQISDVRCCSCKDASDEARRYEYRLAQSFAASVTHVPVCSAQAAQSRTQGTASHTTTLRAQGEYSDSTPRAPSRIHPRQRRPLASYMLTTLR
jgi:hypothetical protein